MKVKMEIDIDDSARRLIRSHTGRRGLANAHEIIMLADKLLTAFIEDCQADELGGAVAAAEEDGGK